MEEYGGNNDASHRQSCKRQPKFFQSKKKQAIARKGKMTTLDFYR